MVARTVKGVRLGNQFGVVRVDATLAKSDELIRPLKKVKIIGDAAGLTIAWPSTSCVILPLLKISPLYLLGDFSLLISLFPCRF
jgi:hypothetical protein